MFNFYELLEILKNADITAKNRLFEIFSNDYAAEYSKIKINNTSRKKALESISKKITFQDATKKVYTTGPVALALNADLQTTAKDSEELTKNVLDILKDARPIDDPHIIDCYALAKCLGLTGSADPYYFEIDGVYYNIALAYNAYSCIAENYYCYANCKIGKNNALIIHTVHGIAIILPISFKSINPAHDATFSKYIQRVKEHNKERENLAIRTA